MNGVIEAICRIYANGHLREQEKDEWMELLRRYLDGKPLTEGDLRHMNRHIRALQAPGTADVFSGLRDQLRVADAALEAEGARLREELLKRVSLTGLGLDRPGAIVARLAPDVSEKLGEAMALALKETLNGIGATQTTVIVTWAGRDDDVRLLDYPVEEGVCIVCQTIFPRRPDVMPVADRCRKCAAIIADA
jgi:hypothetical protein